MERRVAVVATVTSILTLGTATVALASVGVINFRWIGPDPIVSATADTQVIAELQTVDSVVVVPSVDPAGLEAVAMTGLALAVAGFEPGAAPPSMTRQMPSSKGALWQAATAWHR